MPASRDAMELSDSGALARLAISGRVGVDAARQAAAEAPPPRRRIETRRTGARRRCQAAIARLWRPAAVLLILIGPLLAFLTYRAADSWEQGRRQAGFEEALSERANVISQQISAFEEVLHACQGLFDASEEVTREEFATFTRQARARHPCIRTIAWVPRLPGEARPRYPVLYLEPLKGNEPLIGVNLRGRARVRRTIERALDSGKVALSDPIEPVSVEQRAAEAILALGVYAHEDSEAAEEGDSLGVVLLRFEYGDLAYHAEHVTGGSSPAMGLSIVDPHADGRSMVVAAATTGNAESGVSATEELRIAGQTWRLQAVPTALFLSAHETINALLVALAVFFVWELFAGFLLSFGHASRSHALRRQGRMVNRVLQSLGEGVIVAGRDGAVQLANGTALDLIGDDARGLSGRQFAERLRFEDGEGRVPAEVGARPLDRAVAGRIIDQEECLVRTPAAPDGTWVSVSGRPLRGETGEIRGGVLVLRDVNAKRASERRLHERQMEMELAASVQQSLYPCSPPNVAGLDVAGAVYPADETCGDYYDFIPLPDGSLCLAVGDVSGHGLGPALVMAETRAYVRSLAATGTAPQTTLARSNAMLAHDLVDGLFVTMLLLDVNPFTRALSWASAGHTPGLLLDGEGKLKAELIRTGRPLGMFDDSTYETRNSIVFEDGDVLVLMTDGATEAVSPDGELFEEAGVMEVVRRHRDLPAAEILDRVYESIREFSAGLSSRDDVTLLVCKADAAT